MKEKQALDGVEEEEDVLIASVGRIGQTGLVQIEWNKPVVTLANFTDIGEDLLKIQLSQNSDEED